MAPTPSNNQNKGKKAAKKGAMAKAPGRSGGHQVSIEDVEQRILTKMADRAVFGVTEVSLAEVVKFSGYSWPTAAKFIKAKQALVEKGHLEYLKQSKSFLITEDGLKAAPNSRKLEKSKTNASFHEQLKDQFGKPKSYEILQMLSDGSDHNRKETCNALGYKYTTAQAYAQAVSELKTLGFLEAAGSGMFRLTNKAFPCGRP